MWGDALIGKEIYICKKKAENINEWIVGEGMVVTGETMMRG